MNHPLFERLEEVASKYGTATPPVEVRRPLWDLAASIRGTRQVQEALEALDGWSGRISTMLLAELARFFLDEP